VSSVRVLRSWDRGSDSEHQIRLEEEVWLAATLTQFGLVVQVMSALILIYAAGYFATILKGAMCAAGSLTANGFGLPALGVKIITIFSSSLWIIVHRLDVGCEDYPLTRFKSGWLLVLFPLLCTDAFLSFSYLLNLDPEIITSCCGVLFSSSEDGGYSLFDYSSPAHLLWTTALCGGGAVIFTLLSLRSHDRGKLGKPWVCLMAFAAWSMFYLLAILVITVVVSPYVYAMPHHQCPFDLLHYPYAVVGIPLYLFLHTAVLAGLAGSVVGLLERNRLMPERTRPFMKVAAMTAVAGLLLFSVTAAWPPFSYMMFGGQ